MNNKHVLVLWDAPMRGERIFRDTFKALETALKPKDIKLTDILYLFCEHNYINENYRQKVSEKDNKAALNTRERLEKLKNYFKDSSISFNSLMLTEKTIPLGKADDIEIIQKAIEEYVFPELIKVNPTSIHITLASGTREMIFAWISLYSTSKLTRVFGNNVTLWHFSDDSTKKENDKNLFQKLNVPKNPYIDAIELEAHNNKTINTIDLYCDEKMKRNFLMNAPLLLLGERGTGKSTLVETTICSEKLKQKLIRERNIRTVICGQLDSTLADDTLFGHVKGAYTGADNDKDGEIKLADGGILFLDEIQDLPKQTQRKLLRAVQEHKFSPNGSEDNEETSNFQLICASNKSLSELREKLDEDFFDRIAVFVTNLKPLRELPSDKIEELWKNKWQHSIKNGFILPDTPDSFNLVKNTLISSKLYGNIRDIEQLIAYIARDVYQGSKEKSENAKIEAYKEVLKEWKKDYDAKYSYLNAKNSDLSQELLEKEKWDGMNKLFKKWLAEQSEEIFGSQINAAKAMKCEPKTLRNAKNLISAN